MFMVMENECRHNTSQMESVINYFCIILKRYDWRRIVNKHYFDFSFVWPFLFEARFFNGFLSIKSFVFRVYLHFLGTRYRCNVYIYHVERVCFAKKYGMDTRGNLQLDIKIPIFAMVRLARVNKNWWWK